MLRTAGAVATAAVVLACTGGGTASPGGASGSPGGGGDAGGYPEQPIRMVVPFTAGGPTDTVTRLVAEPMSGTLGQQVVVENVTGAGGTLGAGEVAAAPPDGYTVLMHHIGMSTAPSLYADLAYDPLVDFRTIGLVTEVPMTLVGSPEFEPNSAEDLVAHVQENGESVNYGHAGIGAASHLCGLLFQSAVEAKVTEVPYEGTQDVIDDLLGGQIDFTCDQTTNTAEHIQADAVKAYAITSPERNETLPDLETTTEAGLEDVQVTVWHGLYVPKDTPDDVVQALNAALKEALKDQNVIDTMASLGTSPVSDDQATPEAHTEKLQSQIELWRPIIEEAGVEPQ